MDPTIIAAGVSALGSGLNSILGNNASRRAWREQAEYNSPVNQMARLNQAGLNPHLVYGSGSQTASGNMSAPRETQPVQLDVNYLEKQAMYLASKKTESETQAVQKQIDVFSADILQKQAQTANIIQNTATNAFELDKAKELKDVVIKQAYENLNNSKLTGFNIQQDTALKLSQVGVNEAQARKISQEIPLIKAQISNINQSTSNLKKTALSIDLDNQLKQLEIGLRKAGINPNDPAVMRVIGRALDETGLTQGIIKGLNGASDWVKSLISD